MRTSQAKTVTEMQLGRPLRVTIFSEMFVFYEAGVGDDEGKEERAQAHYEANGSDSAKGTNETISALLHHPSFL